MDQDLLLEFADVDERQRELKEELKEVTTLREELQAQILEQMAESEVERFTMRGRTYYIHKRIGLSPKGDPTYAFNYLQAKGFYELIPQKIDIRKMISVVTEEMANGTLEESFPNLDEYFTIHEIFSVRSRSK